MDSTRPRRRRQSLREPLDRRVDNWIDTGRQFVEGVAGIRPGMRKFNSFRSSSRLEKVGQWMGDKLDWFLEDEDGWLEPWQQADSIDETSASSKKRPLEAISRRVPRSIEPVKKTLQAKNLDNEWPDDSSFRVEKWQRRRELDQLSPENVNRDRRESSRSSRRPVPRSSRNR